MPFLVEKSTDKSSILLRCNGRSHHNLSTKCAVGMQLQVFVRFRFRNSGVWPSYLSMCPFSANGTLCDVSRYLFVLFIAFGIFNFQIIIIQIAVNIKVKGRIIIFRFGNHIYRFSFYIHCVTNTILFHILRLLSSGARYCMWSVRRKQ